MSNDTPSWSGDDEGATPPPPPPPAATPPPPPPGASGDWGEPAQSWGAGAAPNTGGLGKRFVARIIDGLIVGIPLGIILIFMMGMDATGIGYSVVTALVNVGYFVFLENSQGGTLGKRMLGMSVVSTTGGNLSIEQSFKRNWWLLLSLVPFLGPLASLGVTIYIAVTISGDERNQGFHDKMADALVLDS